MSGAWNRYWSAAAVSRAGLDLFRVAFFTLVAVDGFLGLSQAARYGAGGFNVSQLPWLDPLLPLPSRVAVAACGLLGAYLALRVVFAVAINTSVLLLTALWGYRYFISQLDVYPHHYLVFLLLLISCAIPWPDARRPSPDPAGVRHWAIRLLVVQVAIVYLWSAIAMLPGPLAAIQLALGVMLLVRWFWLAALLAGLSFHIGMELAGFRSGLFNHVLIAFYLMLVPGGWLQAAARAPRRVLGSLRAALTRRLPAPPAAAAIAVAFTLAGAVLIALAPFEGIAVIAAIAALLGVAAVAVRARAALRGQTGAGPVLHAGVAQLLAGAAILALHAGTDQAFDYHRNLAGSARRLGDHATAEKAYRRLLELDPGNGRFHYHLGNLALQRDAVDEAVDHFRAGQAADPPDADSFESEAQMLAAAGQHQAAIALLQGCQKAAPAAAGCAMKEALSLQSLGRRDEAIATARRAVTLDPRHQGARNVLRALTGARPPPPAPEDPFGDDHEHDHD